jgi:biotin synthase
MIGKTAAYRSPPMPQASQSVLRHDWTAAEILDILQQPLLDLVYQAQSLHRQHSARDIQLATLLSVKTGGCAENCAYCPQSAHHDTRVTPEPVLSVEAVLTAARAAKANGSERFCMGWAWREIKDGKAFNEMLEMVAGVRQMGLEACVTAGMLSDAQAERLAAAGLTAYNHNLDTSPDYYDQIITTRGYDDRLQTLERVRRAGITLCCGGIIGMGETLLDRAKLLETLANLTPHPESVPINALTAVAGTPLADQPPVDPFDLVRICATARILMPSARVRLSAGRSQLSREAQVLCLMAGVNSIFYGEKLLTTENPEQDADQALLAAIGAIG